MNLEQLKEPFAASDTCWRIGQAGKKQNGDVWAKVLAYIDCRNIQDRLDSVCGPEHWANEFRPGPSGGIICGISIEVAEDKWVTKWDGAENSDIEAVKGGLSDSMKRAAVQWGIGRYLYDLGEGWAEIVGSNTQGAHYANCKIKVQGKEEWAQFHWLPPRGVLPDSKESSKAADIAKQHGMTTGDKVPPPKDSKPPSAAYKKAIDKITAAVRDKNPEEIARIVNVAEKAFEDKKLSENERNGITNECTLALKKIKAAEKEPVAA